MSRHIYKVIGAGMGTLLFFSVAIAQAEAATVFREDFEGVVSGIPAGWSQLPSSTWGVFAFDEAPFRVLYGDIASPYKAGSQSVLVGPHVNLADATSAELSFTTRCDTRYEPPQTSDHMRLDVSADGLNYTELMRWNEFSIDTNDDLGDLAVKNMSVTIPAQFLTADFRIRFAWMTATEAHNTDYDGCFIDALTIVTNGDVTAPGGGNPGGGNPGGGNPGGTTSVDVTACGTLATPNATYMLRNDLFAGAGGESCLSVTASNVVLDGNGFKIKGRDKRGSGILSVANSSVKLRNLEVMDFETGIDIRGGSGHRVTANTLIENEHGVVLRNGSDATLSGNRITENIQNGIYLDTMTASTVEGTIGNRNAIGIALSGGMKNVLKSNTITGGDRGILLIDSNDNTIQNNTTTGNAIGIGIEGEGAIHNLVEAHETAGNEVGVALASPSNTIQGGSIVRATEKAIRFFEEVSSNNVIKDVAIRGTSAGALDLSFDAEGPNYTKAAITGTVLENLTLGAYFIAPPGGIFSFRNPFGAVSFLRPVGGSGAQFSSLVDIKEKWIALLAPATSAEGPLARLTFNKLATGKTGYALLRGGSLCPVTTCTLLGEWGGESVEAVVTEAGIYSVRWDGENPNQGGGGTAPTISDVTVRMIVDGSPISKSVRTGFGYDITFEKAGLSHTDIFLINEGNGQVQELISRFDGTKWNWLVSRETAPGRYRIEVRNRGGLQIASSPIFEIIEDTTVPYSLDTRINGEAFPATPPLSVTTYSVPIGQ